MSVRVRIAPSPTGNLHIGTARAALFNWLFARKHGGEFVLRIEDTDLERSKKEYDQNIVDSLEWLGLKWDGPIYRQSERLDIYKRYLRALYDSGKAFWCHHSQAELKKEQEEQTSRKEAPRHICEHKLNDLGRKEGALLRLAVDQAQERRIIFQDAIRGEIGWDQKLISDISLAKNFDTPLYNFAAVVDDIEMAISHVIRGEDHISNTPKQILIYEALREVLGKEVVIPIFAHLPLILAADKSKLSKRHGATAVVDYKKDYLPEALVNFMGSLGFTYPADIISREDMVKEFDLASVHKSGAVFNVEKLNWLNAQYIKKLSAQEFQELIGLEKIPATALSMITERLERLTDVAEFEYFWKKPGYDKKLLIWKNSSEAEVKTALQRVAEVVSGVGGGDKTLLRQQLDAVGQELKNRGLVYWPLRVALTGRDKSPDPVDIVFVLGTEEVLARINHAVKLL